MPAWRIWPTQERLSAVSSPNHGMSVSIRDIAAVLRDPVARRSASAARSRDASVPGRAATPGGGLRQGGGGHVSTLVGGFTKVPGSRRNPG